MKYLLSSILFCFLIVDISFAKEDSLLINNTVFILDTSLVDDSAFIYYEPVTDTTLRTVYFSLLVTEINKYPIDFLDRINISQIVLGQNLQLDGQARAAIPHPSKGILYLNIDESYTETYFVHVFHHELHHCTEYALWNDMFYTWEKWGKRNTNTFAYGVGGAHAYEAENQTIDWYTPNHPQHGFVNLYATLGQEEDRCEIVALIMSDAERKYLYEYVPMDKSLSRKVNLILKLLDKVSATKANYWQKKMRAVSGK